jgi:3-hydroxybutyryl-CoA dehydratase
MIEKSWYEDYEKGEKFVAPGRTITESDLVMFAAFTGDWHPIHTNVEYAAKTPFGERIAHGMLVLVVGSALFSRLGPHVLTPKSFIAFYGMDSVRFVGAVKIGDTIHLEAEVVDLKEKDESRGVVTTQNIIRNQKGEECCVFVAKVLCGRKPGS